MIKPTDAYVVKAVAVLAAIAISPAWGQAMDAGNVVSPAHPRGASTDPSEAASGQVSANMPVVHVYGVRESLTVLDTEQATRATDRIPGGVEIVPDTAYKSGPADTLKDVLAWVPGVFTSDARYGADVRVSIRGSGLSRPYGNRGVNMYMDGVPINTSDGLVDLFEIDPTAYRYVEVYKGANAMRYGANSLGGAINFVTPTGYDAAPFEARLDAGSFGYNKQQASTGGVSGKWDGFLTMSRESSDGYRDHSNGHQERASANFGYRFSADVETRFYFNFNSTRNRMPGELDKETALTSPRTANQDFVWKDQQRNIDSFRLANKTTVRLGSATAVDFGFFYVHRSVDHPNWSYLDYTVDDGGGFVRITDDRMIGGYRNELTGGVNLHNGTINSKSHWYANTYPYGSYPSDAIPGTSSGSAKGALAASTLDKPRNLSLYVNDAFHLRPDLALNLGTGFDHAVRPRVNRLDDSQSGSLSFNNFTPTVGVLWDVTSSSQVFANISRSAEAPTYDVNSVVTTDSPLKAQTATTYEVGTRGSYADYHWDVSLYRALVHNELQCLATAPGSCVAVNVDKTVHQGIEAGGGFQFVKSVFTRGDGFVLNASYMLNDFRFRNDPVYGNNRLAGVPTQLVRAEVLYKHPSGFYAGPSVEWMPASYYADNANTTKVDPYALLNFRLGDTSLGKGWSFYIEGRNLLDKRYISTVDVAGTATSASQIFYPGVGRSVFAGVQFEM